jgi:hypothetical protein
VSWARRIIEQEILAEAIARNIVAPTVPSAPLIVPFPSPYQHKVVEAGEKDVTVYEFVVPVGMVAFIQRVGNNAFEDAYLVWRIDGRIVISPNIDYQIAPCNTPKLIEPWLRVNEQILWTATNNSEKSCHFEVLCDGFYTKAEDIPTLLKMGLPISQA